MEIEYDFLKKYSEYIELYKENKLPVLVCDHELNVGWGNKVAENFYPHLTKKDGFDLLLNQFGKERLLSKISAEGSVWLDNLAGFSGVMLGLAPIVRSGAIFGIIAEFMNANAVIPPSSARLGSITPMRLEASIRESVAGIFREMDVATQLEHQLLEKAGLRGLGLDTGFISASFDGISKHGYHLLRMAANISAYSALCAAPPGLSLASEDIFGLILQAKDAITLLAGGMGIPVEFSLPETGGVVALDAKSFELAFFNVLHNALYFTKKDNRVIITGEAHRGKASVTVSDCGTGIPKRVLPHIFEPYFAYAHGAKAAGAGLGLTVAKSMIEAHGGGIRVKSGTKKGTEVTITIPRAPFARKPAVLGAKSKNPASDKFSPLYVGLVDAIRSPYNPQNG